MHCCYANPKLKYPRGKAKLSYSENKQKLHNTEEAFPLQLLVLSLRLKFFRCIHGQLRQLWWWYQF